MNSDPVDGTYAAYAANPAFGSGTQIGTANYVISKGTGTTVIVTGLNGGTTYCQYRYPLRRHFIELPAGKLEPDEPQLQTAKRELVEECGYEAAEWWRIATLHPGVGYSDEVIELWGARQLTHVGACLDPGEHLEVFPARIEDALDWVRQGLVSDTKTIIGLLWWDRFGPSR